LAGGLLLWRARKMPWKTLKQAKWGHSTSGRKALGAQGVAEWDAKTNFKALKENASKKATTGRKKKKRTAKR
jgi:hypothetical protein